MTLTCSFAGLLGQTSWWHPAKEGALPLTAMAESHRKYLSAFLSRRAAQIRQEYVEHHNLLDTFRESDSGWSKFKSAEDWLTAQPLLTALKKKTPANLQPGEARVEVSLPLPSRFPIADKPLALVGLDDYWLSYSLDESGASRWRFQQEPWSSSMIEALSQHFTTDELGPLDATLEASRKIEVLMEGLSEHRTFFSKLTRSTLNEWEDKAFVREAWAEANGLPTSFKV